MNKTNETLERPFTAMENTSSRSRGDQDYANYWSVQSGSDSQVFRWLPDSCGKELDGDSDSDSENIVTIRLTKQLSDWVRGFSGGKSVQPFVLFLAVLKLLLHKYSNREDLMVGITYNADILPVRTQCIEGVQFNRFLAEVQNALVQTRKGTVDPLPPNSHFQVVYTYGDGNNKSSEVGDSLTVEVAEEKASFSISFAASANICDKSMLQRLSGNFTMLLTEISKAQDNVVQTYPMVTGQEQQLFASFNDTSFDYPRDKCIHQFFIEKTAVNPNQIAVRFENERLTYQQLYDKCCDLALFLQSLNIRPDSLVGLCLERSVEMMVGIHGTLIAGGAYVPMDPDYPNDRLAYMLEDSQASIVLCQGRLIDKLKPLIKEGTTLIALDESWNEIAARAEALRDQKKTIREDVQPNHLAYIIYTSGSTGRPKGVMVEHRALVNRIDWMQRTYLLSEKDVVLQKTPFSFDVSVWEFVWPMMAGATLAFAKPGGHRDVLYLEDLIQESGITTLHFVPSMLHAYLDHSQSRCDSVRQIFCSGEALDNKAVAAYKKRFPRAVLHNLYGPTEAAIDVTFFDCSRLKTPFVPIGAPISNIQIYILDKYNNLQPLGVPGELHIAGDGLARGYHNRHELTSEKFVNNPFSPGKRMYKSGDLARWMEDGNIEYLGRIDTQVKIRGFRIETGEIETILHQHPDINNCAVVVQGEGVEKKLLAFYLAKDTKEGNVVKLAAESLKSFLLQSLPDYMVPAAFVSLEEFPLTPNGKLNRRALESIDVQMESSKAYVAPHNDTEQRLTEIWGETLGIEAKKIGVDDNFFELGGHSLLVAPLLSEIRDQFAVDLPLNTFFDVYTVAGLAEVIKAAEDQDEEELGDIEFEEFTL
ncbi:Long-chain-fatty-acid--CoA ligase [Fulvivirga imtechensis AK7]|uniref:Long-chain-fatty-acid--CoA ligase n=1 Tax=Fulvivirga imtechensis AK7 TaxID=1237149 RepID=L8JWQ9_9BACT|nr:non-ribosomal peptide synthetase [Fulvivirga imtechensis]ELR72059.1 Long-chain-fatty-acid--CoA ligase [Fulvivirga imtechensis AK7]